MMPPAQPVHRLSLTPLRAQNLVGRPAVSFPPAFGEPPKMQTRDLRTLPFGYGMGSGTIAAWLAQKAQELYHETVDEYIE